MNASDSAKFIADSSLIVEEKLDGTNVGIHFDSQGELVLQCRGHLITEGMHAQYDLFKQWAMVKRDTLSERLTDRFILFGEWLYAKHSIFYQSLSHYFFEFDIYDKERECFLVYEDRMKIIESSGIQTVPVVHSGSASEKDLRRLIGPSRFGSQFENPTTGRNDNLMEGLYLRIESNDEVTGRAKLVRPEFVEKIKQSSHWQHTTMIPNQLADDVDIWS